MRRCRGVRGGSLSSALSYQSIDYYFKTQVYSYVHDPAVFQRGRLSLCLPMRSFARYIPNNHVTLLELFSALRVY